MNVSVAIKLFKTYLVVDEWNENKIILNQLNHNMGANEAIKSQELESPSIPDWESLEL